jgi:uncharacterized repeat protein (TIGR02543 family)
MKRLKFIGRKILTIIALSIVFTSLYGMIAVKADTQLDKYSYTVLDNSGNVTITKYTGSGGDIMIPSRIDGHSVIRINGNAFFGSSITNVTIPDSITTISSSAFCSCPSLISVNIPSSVNDIGKRVFSECTKLTSINVASLNQNYSSVDGVLFDKSQKTLIAYPHGKTTTSYTILNSVTSISDSAFESTASLNNLIIPNGVTTIGDYAFRYCSSLKNIEIPSNVKSIGLGVFVGCSSLVDINVALSNASYSSINGVLFDKNQKTLVIYPCDKTATSYMIPNSVTSIKEGFYGCEKLVSIMIPNSVTKIGDCAFYGCTSLTSIDIPNGVTSIGTYMFKNCTALTSVTIPESVTSIGYESFGDCHALVSATIPHGVTYIENAAFWKCYALTSVTIPGGVNKIGIGAFEYCSSLVSVTIQNGVTYIDSDAFQYCTALTSVTLPNSLDTIQSGVFAYCTSLTSISIPYNVTVIGMSAFAICSSLVSVTISNGQTGIGDNAFNNCSPNLVIYSTAGGYVQAYASGYSHNFKAIQMNTITYDSNGGLAAASETVACGSSILISENSKRAGFTFEGWFTLVNGGSKISFPYTVTDNVIFYAHWVPSVNTVAFNSNGGSMVNSQITGYNTTIFSPANPTCSGYTFDGWFTLASGGSKIKFPYTVTDNVTLYAHWSPIIYSVAFISNAGSSVASLTANDNATITAPITPTRPGYTFNGWFTSLNGGSPIQFPYNITGNVIFYAHWTQIKTVGVSYKANIQSIGWTSAVLNGAFCGTSGKSLQIEGIRISLTNTQAGEHIIYQAYSQKKGWTPVAKDGKIAGTNGLGIRMEGFRATLSGMPGYKIRYRAYCQNSGWMSWQTVRNGTDIQKAGYAGTKGKSLRIEAIEIQVIKVD